MNKRTMTALRGNLERARAKAEKAIRDRKRASFIDADTIPSILRELKSALKYLGRKPKEKGGDQ
jgi:hypothetical protein